MKDNKGIKLIALFECLKGGLVLGIGVVLFLLPVENLNKYLHFAGVSFLVRELVHHRFFLLIFSVLYSALRFIEAYGLWNLKQWGYIIGIVSLSIYLPFEFFEIFHAVTVLKVLVTAINILMLIYLIMNKRET